jgi:hypothetical protein
MSKGAGKLPLERQASQAADLRAPDVQNSSCRLGTRFPSETLDDADCSGHYLSIGWIVK